MLGTNQTEKLTEQCQICKSPVKQINHASSREYSTECVRCGIFKYSLEVHQLVDKFEQSKKMALSHWIRTQNEKGHIPDFNKPIYTVEFFESLKLPNPAKQADNLILYLGNHTESLSANLFFETESKKLKLCAIIGSSTFFDLHYLIKYLINETQFINHYGISFDSINDFDYKYRIGLTFQGWWEYEELQKEKSYSKQVFMAMKFGNKDLTDVFENFLVKKFKEDLGLDLVRLIDKPKDGIIDNHLRVEIKKSCLLISDLTDDNYGAYWEAGYAEGLGKSVIYFCNETKFNKESTHFDTSHLQTILWKKDTI
jgi:hypothetical protein